MDIKNLPKENGWYWVLVDGFDEPTPCSFSYDKEEPEYSYFLPGGMGDSSSHGIYPDEIIKIIQKIEPPKI